MDLGPVVLVAVGVATAVAALVAVGAVRRSVDAVPRAVDARLAVADAELRRLADSAVRGESGSGELRQEVGALRQALEEVRVREEERREREERAWAVLHRVSSVLAGAQRAGRAGENVLRDGLSQLPPSMLQRDFRVNGKVVEFALVMPDGRRLPVDSKWSAERELVALAGATDQLERDRLVQTIEREVARRAREAAQYRDDALTCPVSVAAVPDAAYAVLQRAHADAYRCGVIVIPYSMALPIALFLHAIVSRLGGALDLGACLADLLRAFDGMEETLENKVERAATMLSNGAGELRTHVGRARSTLARARTAGVMGPDPDGDAMEGLATLPG